MKKITPICSKCYPPKWMGAKWYHRFFTRIGIYRYHRWCNGCNSTIIIKPKSK